MSMVMLVNTILTILLDASIPGVNDKAQDALVNASPYNPITYGVLVLVLGFVAWLGVREIIHAKSRAEDKYDNLMKDYLKLSQDSITTLSKVEDKIKTLELTNRSIDEVKHMLRELKLKIEMGALGKDEKN